MTVGLEKHCGGSSIVGRIWDTGRKLLAPRDLLRGKKRYPTVGLQLLFEITRLKNLKPTTLYSVCEPVDKVTLG
jgi:hypothetical protein